jgi:hypothetical protein
MADMVTQRNIGAYITGVTSVAPQSSTAQTINGSSIDREARNMPLSMVLHTVVGADSGSPSALSVQSTLQHSPDNSTWVNYQPDGANDATAPALTAVSTENELDIDLTMANRYIRIKTVVGFTGGTSPAIEVAALAILGGEPLQPAI